MGNLSELDKLYSPSAWSKRGNAEWIIKKHLEFTLKGKHKINILLLNNF